ncbi:hypothetical protein PoB_000276500 [Plakobranchus ocellatus]|uniref:Uncharacterized protein n=1 Tax=Plakobranchus ocellatus TaxID=259542 RepID=A0AAV3Y012_9GAST|nr:hypothetical protein PoB_000276500 [Plakobranchus ocellatus]
MPGERAKGHDSVTATEHSTRVHALHFMRVQDLAELPSLPSLPELTRALTDRLITDIFSQSCDGPGLELKSDGTRQDGRVATVRSHRGRLMQSKIWCPHNDQQAPVTGFCQVSAGLSGISQSKRCHQGISSY